MKKLKILNYILFVTICIIFHSCIPASYRTPRTVKNTVENMLNNKVKIKDVCSYYNYEHIYYDKLQILIDSFPNVNHYEIDYNIDEEVIVNEKSFYNTYVPIFVVRIKLIEKYDIQNFVLIFIEKNDTIEFKRIYSDFRKERYGNANDYHKDNFD